jgi:hypothetical protein
VLKYGEFIISEEGYQQLLGHPDIRYYLLIEKIMIPQQKIGLIS